MEEDAGSKGKKKVPILQNENTRSNKKMCHKNHKEIIFIKQSDSLISFLLLISSLSILIVTVCSYLKLKE